VKPPISTEKELGKVAYPIIPAMVGSIKQDCSLGQPGKKKEKWFGDPISKITKTKRTRGVAQAIDYLPCTKP
jgi:hypothetical protein